MFFGNDTVIRGFKLTVAQSAKATRNAGWVPKIYVVLAQFATVTSLKDHYFLADYTHLYKSHYPSFIAKCHITTYIRQLLSCFVNVNTA